MTERPSYLPVLEGIANAERQGYEYYNAWCEHATEPDFKETLRIVANRELEHSLAFTKRIDELGFTLEPADVIDFTSQMAIVTSDCSDLEKARAIGLTKGRNYLRSTEPDQFSRFFEDRTIDVQTGALLGRYIAEERDSARMLIECALMLEEQYGGDAVEDDQVSGRLDALEQKLDDVCSAIERLNDSVSTKAATNGRSKTKTSRS
jgi:rubrerythrin